MSTTYFPQSGLDEETIIASLEELKSDDLQEDGRAYAFTYDAGDDVKRIARRAFTACMGGNGLDPTAYPSARRLENDVTAAALSHLRAPEGAVGTATSGGTESVMLSVKTARDFAQKKDPSLTSPEMLVPETAHASFHKAAHYLGVRLIPVDVDPKSMRACIDDYRAKITDRTILLVASAPSYAHGVIDPISELGALAEANDLLLHVDACIGGWVLPFQRDLGIDTPDFDFNVAGVTSISVDLHKYAFAPKGISVLLQRNRALRDAQYYACAAWSGYTIVNPTMLGSKSIAAMASAWAVLRHLGREGYRDKVQIMANAKETLVHAIERIPGLRVLGCPDMGLVAVTTEGGDVFELADRLIARGWQVQPTYGFGASPAHIHFTIDPHNAVRIDALVGSLQESAQDLPPTVDVPASVVAMLQAVTQGQGGLAVDQMMSELGIVNGQLPQAQANIHRLLDAASPPVREALLVAFLGELFT